MPPPPKFRFSLRTFALALVLLGLLFSHIHTSRRLWQTEEQLSRIRFQHGYLEVRDRSSIEVLQVQSKLEPYTWEWQLYLPPGRDYKVHFQLHDIPKSKFPAVDQHRATFWFSGADEPQPLRVALQRDPLGRWRLNCNSNGMRASVPIEPENAGWLDSGHVPPVIAERLLGQYPVARPFDLLRFRASDALNAHPRNDPPPPLDNGLLIWLEPIIP